MDCMTIVLRSCLAVTACLLLAACKMDYSAIRLAPPQDSVAHVVAGLNHRDGTPVQIQKINGKTLGTNVIGRELLVPAGTNTVAMGYMGYMDRIGWARIEVSGEFRAGAYYIVEAYMVDGGENVRFQFTQVSPRKFQAFMCRAQADLQERLKNVNPQPAPACDAIRQQQAAPR